MKYILLVAALALFIFACGEIDTPSEPGSGDSSSGTGGLLSSGSNGNSTCAGLNCCNGASFDNTKNFCHKENDEEQLYPLCNNRKYNPYEEGCFNGALYPKCELAATRGTCVSSALLRCRQEGPNANYIIDHLPGMTCQPNGAITGTIIDFRESPAKTYKTVQINNQIWLAENLNFNPTGLLEYSNSKCHSGDPDCAIYGRLYDWATMLGLPASCNGTSNGCTPQGSGLRSGLCPETFGIPKTDDWQALVDYAGGNEIAGGRLKSQTGAWANNGYGTDNYNFNALPGGSAIYHGQIIEDLETFIDLGKSSFWWVDTQKESEADYWRVITDDTEARTHFQSKGFYLGYVRCVKYGN